MDGIMVVRKFKTHFYEHGSDEVTSGEYENRSSRVKIYVPSDKF